jgi:hypothetical protein
MHAWRLASSGFSLLILVLALGCDDPSPPAPVPSSAASHSEESTLFDRSATGSVSGRVVWKGEVPEVPPFQAVLHDGTEPLAQKKNLPWPNPNGPVIDQKSRGVGNAVVFLRGVDLRRAKPWGHPPVRVEQRGFQLHVCQGDTDSKYGFVRRGDSIEMVSRQPEFHSLHAGGAAFFTLTFPYQDRLRIRRLSERGIVELTSAAGYYWMRAYLFVDEHAYYTRTDAEGRFTLDAVPPRNYEVVCWIPNWNEERHERDPESCLIVRMVFQKPAQTAKRVSIQKGETTDVSLELSSDQFGK